MEDISWYIGLRFPVFCFRIMPLLKQGNKGPLQNPFEQFLDSTALSS